MERKSDLTSRTNERMLLNVSLHEFAYTALTLVIGFDRVGDVNMSNLEEKE